MKTPVQVTVDFPTPDHSRGSAHWVKPKITRALSERSDDQFWCEMRGKGQATRVAPWEKLVGYFCEYCTRTYGHWMRDNRPNKDVRNHNLALEQRQKQNH